MNSGGAAITGVAEGEEYHWRREARRHRGRRMARVGWVGVWQAADAGRDMLYDVCSSHRSSLIN